MEPIEILFVETAEVACDGGGELGHPKVYLTLDKEGGIDCPYCGQRFELKESSQTTAGQ
jgi:uncharacterized Zn-finger protein